jgi:hypothetical protein
VIGILPEIEHVQFDFVNCRMGRRYGISDRLRDFGGRAAAALQNFAFPAEPMAQSTSSSSGCREPMPNRSGSSR